jgi:hypothetical protein
LTKYLRTPLCQNAGRLHFDPAYGQIVTVSPCSHAFRVRTNATRNSESGTRKRAWVHDASSNNAANSSARHPSAGVVLHSYLSTQGAPRRPLPVTPPCIAAQQRVPPNT